MDVQADETSVRADTSPTLAVGTPATPAPGASRPVHPQQGSFFQDDPYPTFADTNPTPMVPREPTRRASAGSRGLRIAVVVAALAVAAAGAALALVETGVISTTGSTGGRTAAPPVTPSRHSTGAHKTSLLTPTGLGATSATYTVDAPAYGLTIATTTGRSWVSVGVVGQKPIFAGILPPNSSQKVTILGPAQLQIGAGGTSVVVSSNRRTQTLKPPFAPFSYQFTPR
jgi:hypothetical protein